MTQRHLQQVMEETGQAFVEACPEDVPAQRIFGDLRQLYGLDGVHRLSVFFVSLFSGELDEGGFVVSAEEYEALGWLLNRFGDELPSAGELRELYAMLGRAGN